MLTKFYLHYDNTTYELKDDDLYNWDEIRCSYKRDNYDGVVRSFTSQFVFVNRAREILLTLYLRDRYNAQASISVHTITDRWQWEEKFRCPLDFSTVTWEKYTFKINAVDNSTAALIKANKNTKFELTVGSDIYSDEQFFFPRLTIEERLVYEITQGESDDDGSLSTGASENGRLFCGVVSSELCIGGILDWNDDQTTDANSYIVRALRPVDLTISCVIEYDRCFQSGGMSGRFIKMKRGSEPIPCSDTFNFGGAGHINAGVFSSESELLSSCPASSMNPYDFAFINGVAWEIRYSGTQASKQWVCTNQSEHEYKYRKVSKNFTVHLDADDKIAFECNGNGAYIYSSNIALSWAAKGQSFDIPCFTPQNLSQSILKKIYGQDVIPVVTFSKYDKRVHKTRLLGAECIRGIEDAKVYSSFAEFCDWMSVVFGYVLEIEGLGAPLYVAHQKALAGYSVSNTYPISSEPWYSLSTKSVTPEDIAYFEYKGKFCAFNGQQWVDNFPGDIYYNDPRVGLAREDTIFTIRKQVGDKMEDGLYVFQKTTNSIIDFPAVPYHGTLDDINKPTERFKFLHRSELFNSQDSVHHLNGVRDVKYRIDSASIYSTVTVGYETKEYDKASGRDEFNFNITYSTGCSLTDKTLSLICKYRADSYGIEYTAQKRGQDTTDNSADKDLFFVYCSTKSRNVLQPDKSLQIEGSFSDDVFNAVFSPMACVRANAGFIGLQAEEVILKFASSTGNSEIVIDGEPMSADITLNTPLATSAWIEFTTDEVDDIANVKELVEVVDEEGMLYRGYLKEVDVKYTKTEAAKYKLIIKDIEP